MLPFIFKDHLDILKTEVRKRIRTLNISKYHIFINTYKQNSTFQQQKIKRMEVGKNGENKKRNLLLGKGVVLCMGTENEEGIAIWLLSTLRQALLFSLSYITLNH